MRQRALPVLSALVCVAAAIASVAVPAAAFAAPTPDDTRAWSVRPAGPDGKPDARTRFTLQTTPGGTITDQAHITNVSSQPLTLTVYGTDAFNTDTGQFDLLSADHKPTDVGSWMVFATSAVTLQPGASTAVPFKVNVPPTATPGDHAGGVVVSLLTPGADTQKKVNVDARVAVRLYLRIPGNLRPRLGFGPVTATYHGVGNPFGRGKLDVTYTVTNPGNIRLQSHPTVTVAGPFGDELAKVKPKDLPELLPNQSATFHATVPRVFPEGPVTVKVSLEPFTDPQQPVGQAIPAVGAEGTLWAVPWTLLLLIVLVLLVVVAAWFGWRRRRSRSLAGLGATLARMDKTRELVALVLLAGVLAGAVLGAPRAARAAEAVPYADNQAIGFVTLYDKAGTAIKGGNVHDKPFAWKAVASKKPPAPYDGTGRKVTLAAFQPRNGALPASWSGDLLTRAVAYPDADHPTVEATPDALSLQEFMDQFPPKWNGLIQLRMLASMPNQSPLTTQYASTDIKVTGRTWTVVGGGPGAGSGGANIPGVPGPGAAAGAGGGKGAAGDAGLAGGGGLPDRNPIAAILPGVGVPGTLAIAAAVIVGLVLAGVFWRRRRYGAEEGENPSG